MPTLTISRFATPLVAFALCAHSALSQDDSQISDAPAPIEPIEPTSATRFSLSATPRFEFRTDFDKGDGDIQITRTDITAAVLHDATDALTLGFTIAGGHTRYRFDDAAGVFVPGVDEPFEDVWRVRAGVTAQWALNERWAVHAGGFVGSSWADGADVNEGITGGGTIAFAHHLNDAFTYRVGVTARSRLEDDPLILPVLAFTWTIDDTFTLASDGLGLTLTAVVNDTLDVFITGSVEFHDFRADDRASLGALRNGVVQETLVPVGAGIIWRPSPAVALTLQGGAIVSREFSLLSDTGTEFRDLETDPTGYVALALTLRF